jgi:hypothetical protein
MENKNNEDKTHGSRFGGQNLWILRKYSNTEEIISLGEGETVAIRSVSSQEKNVEEDNISQ